MFLPVVTAMTGPSTPTDRVMIALYIGTRAPSSWLLLVLTGPLRRLLVRLGLRDRESGVGMVEQ